MLKDDNVFVQAATDKNVVLTVERIRERSPILRDMVDKGQFNPGAGYRVNNWLSLGAGFSVIWAELDQKSAVNNNAVPGQAGTADGRLKIEDNDTAFGFNLGILLTPRTGTRIGLTYRSDVDLESRFAVGSSARITFGFDANARATATRCCCPPDSSEGLRLSVSVMPIFSINSFTRVSRSCFVAF